MVPKITDDNRRESLEKARQTRIKRAEMRRALKEGVMSVEQVLALADAGDDVAGNMRAKQLISAMPGCAPARSRRIMEELRISDARRVKGLGCRQREGLIERFGGGAR